MGGGSSSSWWVRRRHRKRITTATTAFLLLFFFLSPVADTIGGGASSVFAAAAAAAEAPDWSPSLTADVCLNASFVLPVRRREEGPVVGDRPWFDVLRDLTEGRRAVEVGGPSADFEALYSLPWLSVDVVNVAPNADAVRQTPCVMACGDDEEEDTQYVVVGDRILGRLVFADGSTLAHFAEGTYDAVMAFHTLEHFVDPLRVLRAWDRVLADGDGLLVLVVPWPPPTFDRDVPVSTIYDLLLDFHDDLGRQRPDIAPALERRARIYDRLALGRSFPAAPYAEAHSDPQQHWHVWDFALLTDAMRCMGYDILHLEVLDNWHQLCIARKRQR